MISVIQKRNYEKSPYKRKSHREKKSYSRHDRDKHKYRHKRDEQKKHKSHSKPKREKEPGHFTYNIGDSIKDRYEVTAPICLFDNFVLDY